jgi:hypothetical protein
VFLIISVPEMPRQLVEQAIPDDWMWLAAISGRAVEEAIVEKLSAEPWAEGARESVSHAEFRAISARRADTLLRQLLFERVHALRMRGFNQLFRGAEINMHLSFSQEMVAYPDFLSLLSERGPLELAVRMDRGEI